MAKDRFFRLRHPTVQPARRRRGGLFFQGEEPVKLPSRIKREALDAIESDRHLVEVVNVAGKGDEKPRWKPKPVATEVDDKAGTAKGGSGKDEDSAKG